MAKKAIAKIEVDGKEDKGLAMYSRISVRQRLFQEMELEICVPIESVEGRGSNVFKKSKDLIGKPVKISLESEQITNVQSQLFSGIITSLSLSRSHGAPNELVIRGQSPTVLLDDGPRCRSFSDKDLSGIVKELLQDYPGNLLQHQVSPEFKGTIPYLVQYQESNFQFLHRIADTFGEWIYFDGSKLIFGKPETADPRELRLGRELFSFDLSMQLAPVNFQLNAYDYNKNQVLESKGADQDVSNHLDPSYGEHAFKKAGNLFSQAPLASVSLPVKDQKELDSVAKRRLDQRTSGMILLSGTSDYFALGLGTLVKIVGTKSENPAEGLEDYGQFFLTAVGHSIMGNGEFQNFFEGIPKESGAPPHNFSIRHPVCELQPAVVKENHDPDGLGRIRVQFHWQKDPEMTPWIRAASSHGGKSGGFFVIPEIGDEVLVGFEHQNPDKPIAQGSVYHGKAKPSGGWQNSDNNFKAIKTKSGNEIILNDTPGKEEIKIMNKGGEHTITLTMAGNKEISISSCNELNINATKINISASDDFNISAKNLTINTQEKFTLSAGTNVEASSGAKTAVSAGSDAEISAGGNLKISASTNAELSAGANLDLKANAAATFNGNASAKVSGAKVDVEGKGPVAVKGTVIQLN